MERITPFLWFDNQAEEAANYYTSIFKNSSIAHVSKYGKEGQEIHGKEPGSVMTVEFQLDGQRFVAINGGPQFKFNESTSFVVNCNSQEEVDYYWEKLTAGGDPRAQQCGWLKDKYGLSWQVVPKQAIDLLKSPDPATAGRVMQAVLQMKKIDIKTLQQAADRA